MQELVRKLGHNHNHEISRDSIAKLPLFRPTQPFLFLEKLTGPILPFMALAHLYLDIFHQRRIYINCFYCLCLTLNFIFS